MIELTRLGRDHERVLLNPDLVVTIEAHPDTVIHLATGSTLLVAESEAEVVERIRAWRVEVLSLAMGRRRAARRAGPGGNLAVVEELRRDADYPGR